jgi:hypothetical protein
MTLKTGTLGGFVGLGATPEVRTNDLQPVLRGGNQRHRRERKAASGRARAHPPIRLARLERMARRQACEADSADGTSPMPPTFDFHLQRHGASRPVMNAEISWRYRTARAVPLLSGTESRRQWAVRSRWCCRKSMVACNSPVAFAACKARSVSQA